MFPRQSIQTIAVTLEMLDLRQAIKANQRSGNNDRTGNGFAGRAGEWNAAGRYYSRLGEDSYPAEILVKPGKLTDLEFMTIPQAGYDIRKHVKFPWPIADISMQHHDRPEGAGNA